MFRILSAESSQNKTKHSHKHFYLTFTMAAPATTTRTAVVNTELSAGKRILVLRAFRRMWKPLVDSSQLDRQGRWMSTTQDGKPCFMFSQEDAVPVFFDHTADYKDALTQVLADKLGMAYMPAAQLLEQEKIMQAGHKRNVKGNSICRLVPVFVSAYVCI